MLAPSIKTVRVLLALGFASLPLAAHAQTVSAACKPVMDANTKEIMTPHHSYQSQTSSAKGAPPQMGEVISMSDASYVLYAGKWRRINATPQTSLDQMKENLRNTKVYSCQKLPDESVGGVSAAVYTAHTESEMATSDTKFWVARSTGLIAREEIDIDGGDASTKRHMSLRYDYANVRAPAGVK